MPKRRPPSRLRYEAEHPTVTARVPAEVKAKLDAALEAEGLNFSEWVQARVGGHVADAVTAREKGRAKGHREGEAAGYRRGLQEAQSAARWGGFVAGLLEAHFRDRRGLGIDANGLARHLLGHPGQHAAAEALLRERPYGDDFARLLARRGVADDRRIPF